MPSVSLLALITTLEQLTMVLTMNMPEIADFYASVNDKGPFWFEYWTYKKGTDIITESQLIVSAQTCLIVGLECTFTYESINLYYDL